MKAVLFLMAALLMASSAAIAQETATTDTMALNGDIIDNMCATANSGNLIDFVKAHPKDCALLPACAASGYSILSDGVLYKFDNDSSAKVEEFLKVPENTLKVTVTVKKVGDEINLLSISNQ